jgi:hypothetical protein
MSTPTPVSTQIQIWEDFRNAFCKALDETDKATLLDMWSHVRKKTFYYEKTLMPSIAGHLSYELQIERQRCDYSFLNQNGVPLIAVESENDYRTAWHEMESLCSLAAPVKILILSCDWQGVKGKYLSEWGEIIRKHHAVVSVDSRYAIIVGEWAEQPADARLNYSFTLVDTAGNRTVECSHTAKHS